MEKVLEVFDNVMMHKGKRMDTKAAKFWANALHQGTKTIDDLSQFIIRGQEYKNLVKKVFVDMFYDMLSGEDYQDSYEEFLKKHEDTMITEDNVREFIVSSPVFKKKYTNIIVSFFQVIKGNTPNPNELEILLNNFKNVPDYSIDTLKLDIESIGNISTNVNVKSIIADEGQGNSDTKLTPNIDMPVQQAPPVVPVTQVLTYVDKFEEIYDRSMNVREFLFYKSTLETCSDIMQSIKDFKDKHVSTLVAVQEMLLKYLGYNIDEDKFIRDYLFQINDETFLEDLKISIIASTEYETKMKHRLNVIYNQLYDEELNADDQEYIFEKIKAEGFELLNEELNTFIVDFKNESDHITERIFRIIIDTFGREPDCHEIDSFSIFYRKNAGKTLDEIDELVEKELQDSLEYHDVLKKKIRDTFMKIKGVQILPSLLYSTLQKIVSDEDKKNIDTHIEAIIQEL